MRIAIVSAAFVALAASFGAGAAAAADPVSQPDRVGLRLSHGETLGLSDGPLPAIVTMMVPLNRIGAGLKGDTKIFRDDQGGVHASLRQIIMEAADHPDGTVTIYLNAPGTRNGRVLDVYQNWQ
ncbi:MULTISPECIES: hypothetical protein [Nocardia]|uniref:Uncharacterized protein n=1 Tax=Nocardia arthritidis TaxID=228602 RepID=A0A6G9YS84_9NOCA|nr:MULTISPECIES: hypothetical protein [Nocardia]QIS16064.1 hypothetical protein F5544_41270 [Nocardia arthritidis]